MNRVVLRLGEFHIACTLCAIIGRRFGDAGLRNLIVESGMCGSNAVGQCWKGDTTTEPSASVN
jgi:hypothetical protein